MLHLIANVGMEHAEGTPCPLGPSRCAPLRPLHRMSDPPTSRRTPLHPLSPSTPSGVAQPPALATGQSPRGKRSCGARQGPGFLRQWRRHIHGDIDICIDIHTHTHTSVYVGFQMYVRVCVNVHVSAYVYADAGTYGHTHLYTQTYGQTCMCVRVRG